MKRRMTGWAGRLAALALAIAPIALAGTVGGLASCSKEQPGPATQYHCPMHPTYVSDKPGDCPICGMRLVPIGKDKVNEAATRAPPHAAAPSHEGETTCSPTGADPGHCATVGGEWVCPMEECGTHADKPGKCPKCGMDLVQKGATTGAASAAKAERRLLYYRSPMDPKVTSPTPAKDSMGMDFVPVYSDEVPAASSVPGLATVETTEEGRRLAGVQVATARRERIERTIRAVGTVVSDETRIRHVHTKIAGWVDKLYVDFTGQAVRRGQPIMALYSQELMATQEEYLRAREAAGRFAGSSLPEVRRGGEDLVQAARRRLELFDVPPGFIAQLERTGKAQRTVPVLAPSSGIVIAKEVFEGQQVEPNMELFTVTDLSHVWIEADVYENEATRVRVGDSAVLTLAQDPGTSRTGRVKFVSPTLNPETRTVKVRFDFDNPDGALKPAMYANVQITLLAADGVVVPDSAVMDTGLRQVVFVAADDGTFAPRVVRVGIRSEGRAQILEGLRDGERVAVAANFLLDSESRLRSALGGTP